MSRLSLISRVVCLAAILGLSLSLVDLEGLQTTILLAAVAAAALGAEQVAHVPKPWPALVEGGLAALVTGLVLPGGAVALPYLVVPPLIVGVARGWRTVVAAVALELFGFVLLAASTTDWNALQRQASLISPWLVTALGVGLVGVWTRQLRQTPIGASDPTYESAHRLLSQLRTVARRLSSGLDAVSMATQLLNLVHDVLGNTRAAVFVRSDGGVLVPLAYRGRDARDAISTDDPISRECWDEMEPVHGPVPSGLASTRHRTALPLRVGARMIGLVVVDSAYAPKNTALVELMRTVDEHSLRLDTAMVFDEVRSIATVEERHRLAREIHDGVAQEVASLGYAVDDLLANTVELERRKDVLAIRRELTRVVSELRLSIFDLRSEVTPSGGLGSAISDYVREVGARSGMTVHLTLDEGPTRLRAETETELLRIAQEAITNARKHSGARNLWVHCKVQPPNALIQVRDDGRGLGQARDDSYGMRIMRERARRIHADLRVDTTRDDPSGTTVLVTLGSETEPAVPRSRDEEREDVRADTEHGPAHR